MSEASLLQDAKDAIQHGDKPTARSLLHRVTAQNPGSEVAWLWLSAIAETPEQEKAYLERVLAINPNNSLAIKHMARFRAETRIPRYESANLMPGEQVVYSAKLTSIIFIRPIIITVSAALLLLCTVIALFQQKAASVPGLFLCCTSPIILWLVAGILAIVFRVATFYTTVFLLTNRRVLVQVGIFSRKSRELLLSRVEGVDIYQDFWGRTFNYGTVIVTGTGGLRTPFPLINHPLELRDAINWQLSR